MIACNNYSLLDKFQNPGTTSTEKFTNNFYAFVTSWSTTGDISGQPYSECSGFTGLIRADCACTRTAASSGLRKYNNHQFRAYMSMVAGSVEPRCRLAGFGASCGVSIVGPWFNTAGQIVVNNLSELSGSLTNPMKFSEKGQDMTPGNVWTGTGAAGNFVNTCNGDWSVTDATPVNIGDLNATATQWQFIGSTSPCNNSYRIYCFAAP